VDRGGLALRQVRVRTDIRPEVVYLTDVQDRTDLDDLDQPPPVGWQPATAVTGYEAPFEIRYLRDQDGSIVAMASDDITSRGSYEPIVEGLAEISLGLIGARQHSAPWRSVRGAGLRCSSSLAVDCRGGPVRFHHGPLTCSRLFVSASFQTATCPVGPHSSRTTGRFSWAFIQCEHQVAN
jgi:hypothetical protein